MPCEIVVCKIPLLLTSLFENIIIVVRAEAPSLYLLAVVASIFVRGSWVHTSFFFFNGQRVRHEEWKAG